MGIFSAIKDLSPIDQVNGVYGDSAGVADGTTGLGSYADITGDPHASPNCPPLVEGTKGVALFNCGAYTQTQGFTFGNSGRNSLNNPWRTNFDMSVYKVFKPRENINLQFRAEAFNIFNRPELAAPQADFTAVSRDSSGAFHSNGFGSILSTVNPGPVGTGTPRQLQFMLRMSF